MQQIFVALDLEATGMDPTRHEIIEVALVAFTSDAIVDRFSSLVRPAGRLSLDIATLTGLAADELETAPTWDEVAPAVRRFLAGRPVVGQSPQFDLGMLAAAGVSHAGPVYDTYELAALLLPNLPAYNLATVARVVGVPAPASHRAAADAETTALVFQALLRRIARFDRLTREQIGAYAALGGMQFADLFGGDGSLAGAGPLFDDGVSAAPAHELSFLTMRERSEALHPSGSRKIVNPDRVRTAFAAGGPLAHVIPGYEQRRQQVDMAAAVARAFNDEQELVVEAGTGTGKSLAYLVPAAMYAIERGEPVVVSTNTLALQDQLFRKDIPDLVAALGEELGEELATSVLKGRANYLCLRRWFAWQRQPTFDPAEARLKAKVLAWLGETDTGDRAELRLATDEEANWRHVSEDEGACVPARCVFQQRNQCFLYRARREAERSHLVIVNHALLLSDVMAGSRVLPDYEHLVIDEAHHLEDQATTQFGYGVNERDVLEHLDALVKRDGALLNGTLPTLVAYLTRREGDDAAKRRVASARERLAIASERADAGRLSAARLFARLLEGSDRRTSGGYDRTVRLTDYVRRDAWWLDVELLLEPLASALRDLDDQVRWFIQALESIEPADADEGPDIQYDELTVELGISARAGADLQMRFQSIVVDPEPDVVCWVERSPMGDRVSLQAAPLDVGAVLRDDLFAPLRSVVLTSATITTDGSFDFVNERLGLERPVELIVPSPFDYERSTLLYLADDIPEPGAQGYAARLHATLIETCAATGGRALVLFTSHAALQAAARAMKGPLEERGIIVLAQRIDGSPRQLIERLRHTDNVVVLGAATFWEGVDIVGPALSLLAITRLPFSVPSDPVFAARSELFDDPFGQYAVPQAILRFKQGFGRLIRSAQDRGVCAVLDRRVLSKRYGASFVQSLPECAVTIGSVHDLPDAAAEWLGR
ncbi:MAG TPA: helicase C-terminal domain-containing protein [Thermomicrobiales bacterium]|nr:helicase C-terminal domain-containing protein [Thermomicrobiales bacterium]